MSEQTEINYLDGEVVWVKLGSCWWPGEVVDSEKLPADVLPSFKKPPIAVVKFFQESTYEYVKNNNAIYKYNCSRKHEFIKKGLQNYRSNKVHMEKFPEDIVRAETETGGDPDILTSEEFTAPSKSSYAGLFGSASKKTPVSGRGRRKDSSGTPRNSTPVRRINREKSDYKVHILVQGPKTPIQATDTLSTPSTSRAGSESEAPEDKTPKADKPLPTFTTPTTSGSIAGVYPCPVCSFTTTRLNVLILHNKTHSATYTPYTPTPVRKKPVVKSPQKSTTPNKTPKARKPRKEKVEKIVKGDDADQTEKPKKTEKPENTNKTENTEKVTKKSQARKRSIEDEQETVEVKKPKTDEEIKSSLLADWDDMDSDSDDKSPEEAPASPGAPAAEPARLPAPPAAELARLPAPPQHAPGAAAAADKPESESDSKYEFCEDEDWSLEADAGRKIPRVKNPAKRREERKSISIDDDDVAREVAELLNRTTMPDLPAAPEPLTVEENFPEPSIVKSPDKKVESVAESSKPAERPAPETQPTKAIFKTKTFFRSRHSRSQDAIGKYVAEQLNAAERMDTESELNGSDALSSPEARESPPIEHVKVARLAPKIQLKKMKAEAAQSREKEKSYLELVADDKSTANGANNKSDSLVVENVAVVDEKENCKLITPHSNLDVLYPTQEIKPINKDIQLGPLAKDKNQHIEHEELGSTFIKEDIVYDKKVIADKSDDENVVQNSKLDIIPESIPPKSSEPFIEPFMNESTASAVDALLSVSRDTDRVTKIISDDPPEDLFEDDNKDNGGNNNINGFTEELKKDNGHLDIAQTEDEPMVEEPVAEQVPEEVPKVEVKPELNEELETEEQPKVEEEPKVEVKPELNEELETEEQPKVEEEPKVEVEPKAEEVPTVEVAPIVEEITTDVEIPTLGEEPIEVCTVEESPVVEEVPTSVEEARSNNHKDDIKYEDIDLNESNNDLTHKFNIGNNDIPITKVDSELHHETVVDNIPSESDLQIAEALINLPATAIQNIVPSEQENLNLATHFASEPLQEEVVQEEIIQMDNNIEINDDKTCEAIPEDDSVKEPKMDSSETTKGDSLNARYETEEEKSENLYAAQSLVEMSESIDHKIKMAESKLNEIDSISTADTPVNTPIKIIETNRSVEQKIASLSSDNNSDPTNSKSIKFETSSSKLLKILEEPCMPKIITKTPTKQAMASGKEKILNIDVGKAAIRPEPRSPKQKIIIRRNTPGKNIINSLNELGAPESIVLSRSTRPPGDAPGVQTYTITAARAPPRRSRPPAPPAPHKLKQLSLVTGDAKPAPDHQTADDAFYDINSMPIVLSDDILTPENIEKMPIVMSDGKIITNPANPPKLIKTKPVESEKIVITTQSKPELKTLLINPTPEVSKATTPNILSKSSKLRGSKPMLVIDKATGKQKIIMTKSEPAVKEIKQAPPKPEPAAHGAAKPGKFIIVPTGGSPRPARAQKIVIDPQTGKAHVLVAKPEPQPDAQPVSAQLLPQPDAPPGNTVMIITNAQGAQSRILLTPEHEKILFPNKQQPKVSQLKTVTHRIATGAAKTVVTTVGPAKPANTKIVPKQKSAIITSKGQLIVGGRVATTAQNIAPMPEIRPKQRIIASEPRKLAQTVQKTSSEPLIFLQQKSGQVMQLTTAQFEHLQRTGQIIQKTSTVPENKIVVQKSIAISSNETIAPAVPKKMRRPPASSPQPAKRAKQEVAIAPAPAPPLPAPPLPALAPLAPLAPPAPAAPAAPVASAAPAAYPDLDNFEELLPSTAIVRPPSPAAPPPPAAPAPPPPAAPAPAPLADGQLLAVPGEHFGGPVGTFYLCVEDNGSLTPIDNQPLVLENNQLVPMPEPSAPERRDILEAALANSDVFHEAPPARGCREPAGAHCRVSATSSTLHQPIMTPAELPSLAAAEPPPASLEAGLAVIGAAPPAVPTSLELPITVTDPRIAASMPLLLEEPAGKSMPLLTDELAPAWRAAEADTITS